MARPPAAAPVLISGGYTWASISTRDSTTNGFSNTCGVTTAGVGYCWGANSNGQVGDGTTTQRNSPTLVSGGYTWASIKVGHVAVCGVTTTNVGYCWGYNNAGQFGNNTGSDSSTPVPVSGGYSWTSISEGGSTTCGVTTSGAGYCWGANSFGQVGDGTTATRWLPTAVPGGYTWSSISAGFFDTCGVTTSGTGYCWGYNADGEDGNNNTTEQDSPVTVSGGYTWSQITAGFWSTCGITTSGANYCWGNNFDGQVGNGATSSPVQVPTTVSGGRSYSTIVHGFGDWSTQSDTNCGLALDGIVYCWGNNTYGQIGDGTTTDRSSPVEAAVLFETIDNTTVSATVDPTFTFTVANQSSVCNGESNFVSGAGTASTVALGHLAAGANVSGGQALSVAGNAGSGFVVYVAGSQATQNLRSASHNWTDVSGSYASPATLGAGERFGYTYKDSTSSSSVTNPTSANFIALTNASTNAVMGSASSESGSGCVSYDAQTSASTPAASYAATVVYTAVPTF